MTPVPDLTTLLAAIHAAGLGGVAVFVTFLVSLTKTGLERTIPIFSTKPENQAVHDWAMRVLVYLLNFGGVCLFALWQGMWTPADLLAYFMIAGEMTMGSYGGYYLLTKTSGGNSNGTTTTTTTTTPPSTVEDGLVPVPATTGMDPLPTDTAPVAASA